MRLPFIPRRRHDRDMTAAHMAQLVERTGWTRDAANVASRDFADALERRARGYDLDAEHMESKQQTTGLGVPKSITVPPLTSGDRRVIADELRTIARDYRPGDLP